MRSLITFSGKGYVQHYCVTCADENRAIRARLEKDLPHVTVSDLVFDEVCEGCGSRIRDVLTYRRIYQLKPVLEMAMTTEIPAQSAIEAQIILHEAIDKKQVGEAIQSAIHEELSEGEMIGEGSCSYHVAEPQVLPPHPSARLMDLPQKPPLVAPTGDVPITFAIMQAHMPSN